MPMPSKRCNDAVDAVRKQRKQSETSVLTHCALVAQGVMCSTHISKSCRDMLLSGIEMSLGIPKNERDNFQSQIAAFMGEILQQRERDLQSEMEKCEHKLSLERCSPCPSRDLMDRSKHHVAEALESVVSLKSLLAGSQTAEKDASFRLSVAEAARSELEAEILAGELERDICERGRSFFLSGQGEVDARCLERVIAELELEDSLVLMFPCIVQKAHDRLTHLEQIAAKHLAAGLGRQASFLKTSNESRVASVIAKRAEIEVARHARNDAEKHCRQLAEALTIVSQRVGHEEAKYKALTTTYDEYNGNVAKAEKELADARCELQSHREGPCSAFDVLQGDLHADDFTLEAHVER